MIDVEASNQGSSHEIATSSDFRTNAGSSAVIESIGKMLAKVQMYIMLLLTYNAAISPLRVSLWTLQHVGDIMTKSIAKLVMR